MNWFVHVWSDARSRWTPCSGHNNDYPIKSSLKSLFGTLPPTHITIDDRKAANEQQLWQGQGLGKRASTNSVSICGELELGQCPHTFGPFVVCGPCRRRRRHWKLHSVESVSSNRKAKLILIGVPFRLNSSSSWRPSVWTIKVRYNAYYRKWVGLPQQCNEFSPFVAGKYMHTKVPTQENNGPVKMPYLESRLKISNNFKLIQGEQIN